MNSSQEASASRHDATSRDVSRPVATQRDTSRYSLSAETASLRFSTAGVPRSPRTVMRYCQTGHLDCIKIDTEKNERYLITPDSLEKRIEELLSVDVSRHDEIGRDTSAPAPPASSAPDSERIVDSLRAEIENLEQENFDLKITNRGKDEFVKLLREERAQFVAELKDQAHQIGQLESRLALSAGTENTRQLRDESRSGETRDGSRDELSDVDRDRSRSGLQQESP